METPDFNHNEFRNTDSLLNFLNVIFKRRRIILTFFVSVVGVVTVASFLKTPVFEASSKLLVERELDSEKALLFRINDSSGYEHYNWIQSEIEIITSHPVAVQVVKEFNLHELDQDGKVYTNAEKFKRFEEEVMAFGNKLKVDSRNESNVLSVSYEDKDPQLATAVVEGVIEAYLDQRARISNESRAYEFFEEQMRIIDGRLSELEKRQAEYKQNEGVLSPEAQKEILLARLADYEKTLTNVRTKRISKEAGLAVIKEDILAGEAGAIPVNESSSSPSRERYIAKLKGDLLDLELQREFQLQKFTPQFEDVVYLANQIKVTMEKIDREISEIINMEETAIRVLKAEESVLQASISKTRGEMQDFTKKELELARLSRGITEDREIYSMFLRQREEARISLAKHERGVKVSVISPAFVSPDHVKPKKALNIILALILGLIGGVGLAFIIEYFDCSVSSPTELEKSTGIYVLGSIREVSVNG